jgi:predicted secreted Zn-dependent protease
MPDMTTSQRAPRRALLRRVGPWVVLAAMLTGCASPAAQTALVALQDGCDEGRPPSTSTCEALSLIAGDSTTVVDPGVVATAAVLTSGGGASEGPAKRAKPREGRAGSTRQSSKPRTETRPRQRTETKPRRVTRRVPKVRMPSITASYFGGGVTVARFAITGDTRSQILRSIRTKGPHGGAQGVTQPYLKYRFTFKYDRKGRCRVVRTGSSAVSMSFRITLPKWAATVGTDRTTASWWASELRETAAHERNHVRLWRNAVAQANRVVATSSCRSVGRRLDAIWDKAITANCRFDAAEYGISMRACRQR